MKKKLNLQTILIGVVAILLVIILVVQLSGDKGETRMEQLKAETEAEAEAEPIAEVISSKEPAVNTDDKGNEISGMELEVVIWLKQGFGDKAEIVSDKEEKAFGILIDDESFLTSNSFQRKFLSPLVDYSEEVKDTYGEGYTFYIGDMTGIEGSAVVFIQDGNLLMNEIQ